MIETIDLTKRFEHLTAVEGVTLSVQPGEVLALLGPNGAGKTTTVRMLTSIIVPSAGQARVAGFDVVTQAAEVRARVGVLTEGHGLYLRMNGREYLDFFGDLYGLEPAVRRHQAESLSTRFGLGEALSRRIGEYSKGMRQKLALVRAMMHNPPVLLLDEPTSAMDPHSARQVRDAIKDLRGDGRAIILTTHNLVEAEELADRIAVIRKGRVVASGTTLELKAQLFGPPLMELRFAGPVDGAAGVVAEVITPESEGHNWLRYRSAEFKTLNPLLLRRLAERGFDVLTLSEVPQSLEEVYLRIVNQ